MDRFTRNYSIGLGIVVAALIGLWIYSVWSPRVWELNAMLEADPQLSDYPYQFRVRSLADGVATLSTPRSETFPAIRFLALIQPELARLGQDDPEMVAAQQLLIDHQKRAMALIAGQSDVKSVHWELDVQWLAGHGVHVPGSP
jgi:hypothetical protein